ncbi:MAG: hypothetical protein WEC59_02460 [Salibacteraceae bacterium]
MNIKLIISIATSLLINQVVIAQNEQDALNLSRDEITGSARSVAMGGAFTALGGDLSGLQQNPGGVAVFRTNEFSLSPSFHTNISNTSYYGNEVLDSKTNFNFSTLGVVGTKDLTQAGKWRSTAIGIGMNRSFSYHKSFTAQASDVPSSLIDDYEQTLYANDIQPDDFASNNTPYPFDIYLAWVNYLLDTLGGPGYYNASGNLPKAQTYTMEQSGAKRNSFLTFGGNYDDRLYIGGIVNISRIQMDRSYRHHEKIDDADSTTVLNEFTYEFDESISGYGISAGLGIIYRPITPVRIGFSLTTPTVYSLNIEYESSNQAVFLDDIVFDTESPQIGRYDFRLNTPLKSNFGFAYIFKKYGLISADVEYVDYTGMRMQGLTDAYNFGAEEEAIKTQLQQTLNLRFGGEVRVNQYFSLRAGYALYGNPYKEGLNLEGGFSLYSLGLGYRSSDYFVDAAYQNKTSSTQQYFYDPNLVEASNQDYVDHRFTITLGYRF